MSTCYRSGSVPGTRNTAENKTHMVPALGVDILMGEDGQQTIHMASKLGRLSEGDMSKGKNRVGSRRISAANGQVVWPCEKRGHRRSYWGGRI